ncbi:MAG: hypothetical protein HGA76_10175 [Candidatus Firestonebacteria bacterium]|nr:hypothetical protein [Candidatus Firestonebacteria bacterium]
MTQVRKNPLGLIMNIVESMGLEVTYAYADLIFVAHNAFVLQMGENPETVNLYFNQESDIALRPSLAAELSRHGQENNLTVVEQGLFSLEQAADEKLKLTFIAADAAGCGQPES